MSHSKKGKKKKKKKKGKYCQELTGIKPCYMAFKEKKKKKKKWWTPPPRGTTCHGTRHGREKSAGIQWVNRIRTQICLGGGGENIEATKEPLKRSRNKWRYKQYPLEKVSTDILVGGGKGKNQWASTEKKKGQKL